MLQAGRSWDQFLMRSLRFFNVPDPSSFTVALGPTQPLIEMSNRNHKSRLVHKADNSSATCEPIAQKIWELLCLTMPRASKAYYRGNFVFFVDTTSPTYEGCP
jgi:hypothetical protein